MNRTTRLSWIVFILLLPITSFSQGGTSSTPTDPDKTEVIYTGRLLGYFRVPSLQPAVQPPGQPPCPATSGADSEAAKTFKAFRQEHSNSILLGTGDNFAPQLEARVFSYLNENPQHTKYHPANKELYFYDTLQQKWVPTDEVSEKLEVILKAGKGTIPTDNVACFLAAAGYAAVVPGRHDFYYGAERLRQLARLMAPLKPEYGNQAPQMLGANLVLKTTLVDSGDPVPNKGKPVWMETDWPKEYSLLNLPKTVYPWFQSFHIKISPDDPAQISTYEKKFLEDRFYVCKSKGRPNEIETPGDLVKSCRKLDSKIKDSKQTSVYKLPIKTPEYSDGKNGHFSNFTHSTNYALCVVRNEQGASGTSEKIPCQRFSVHLPFFYFPRNVPKAGSDYTDPDPFVLIEKQKGVQPNDVAIFGVVDLQLPEQVGVLNFAWKNDNDDYKSVVSVEDPAQALREQLEYFEQWYKNTHNDREFHGLKVLLAQMSPQRARMLATRFPGFQIVVSGADQEQETTEVNQTLEWSTKSSASAFVAVPAPYFNTQEQTGILEPGFIKAKPKGDGWTLESATAYEKKPVTDKFAQGSLNHNLEVTTRSDFEVRVDQKLKECLPTNFKQFPNGLTEKLKFLTLCAIRQHVNADLAIVQKRDFFPISLDQAGPSVHVQQFLDRFVWKGDLLTVMLVPGKSIKEALKHSGKVEGDEKAVLTLDSDKGRGFEQVGAKYDPDREQYLINEVPIDDAKTYTVVTTDYLGAGDTGYAELVASALNPRKQPDDFPKELETISSIVCRKLYPDSKDEKCLPNISRDSYLDAIAVDPPEAYEQRGAVKKFFRLSPLGLPDKTPPAKTTEEGLQQEAERREVWRFSLRKLSLGLLR